VHSALLCPRGQLTDRFAPDGFGIRRHGHPQAEQSLDGFARPLQCSSGLTKLIEVGNAKHHGAQGRSKLPGDAERSLESGRTGGTDLGSRHARHPIEAERSKKRRVSVPRILTAHGHRLLLEAAPKVLPLHFALRAAVIQIQGQR
jgi:hypothetical protein